jgi:hypothetical protein
MHEIELNAGKFNKIELYALSKHIEIALDAFT